jgi:hypothetical protein
MLKRSYESTMAIKSCERAGQKMEGSCPDFAALYVIVHQNKSKLYDGKKIKTVDAGIN